MKYLLIALMAISANAQTILDQCYQASYATDYVYENIFNVRVSDKSEELLELLSHSSLEVLSEKDNSFVIKASLKNWHLSESLLEGINNLPEASVSCRYK